MNVIAPMSCELHINLSRVLFQLQQGPLEPISQPLLIQVTLPVLMKVGRGSSIKFYRVLTKFHISSNVLVQLVENF